LARGRPVCSNLPGSGALGAAFAICPDNTHIRDSTLIRDQSPIPWLHIAEEIAALASERGLPQKSACWNSLADGRAGVYRALAAHGMGIAKFRKAASASASAPLSWTNWYLDDSLYLTREYFQEAIRVFQRNGAKPSCWGALKSRC